MISTPSNVIAQHQPLSSQVALNPQSLSRHKRETPAPAETSDHSRAAGDRELASEYSTALVRASTGERNITINVIPPHSTFGQWWGQLQDAFQSPEVRQWIRDNGINADTIKLKPESGEITFKLSSRLDPEQKLHTVTQDNRRWAAISGPILEAARVLNAGHPDTSFAPPATELNEPVAWSIVGRFYQERQDLTRSAMYSRAVEIDREPGFVKLDSATSAGLIQSRSEDALQGQREALGDIGNRLRAVAELRHLAAAIENGTKSVQQIEAELKKRTIDLPLESSYQTITGDLLEKVSLLKFIEHHGWDIPTTHEQLMNLAEVLSTPEPREPVNGDLGGVFRWSEPLDQKSLEELKVDIRTGKVGEIELSPFKNVLEYLLNNRSISAEEQRNPRQLINTLITSPRGKALGEAIQTAFEQRGVKGNTTDWLLAALNMGSASLSVDGPSNRSADQIEGYQLVSPGTTGKTPSTVVKELADHLVANGKASSPEKAAVQAYLMLASRAPEFLVKDIPEGVVAGTHSWVSFATAVARIEAKAPGNTASMNYAEVMLEANTAPISDLEREIEYTAQTKAIKDWAFANGMGYPSNDASMNTVRQAFNAQIQELRGAAETEVAAMPTRKVVALEQLKIALPDIDPKLYEEKCISVQPSNRYFPGPYSILDLYMDGRGIDAAPSSADNWGEAGRSSIRDITYGLVTLPPDGRKGAWVSSSGGFNIDDVRARLKELPRADDLFKETFQEFSSAVKKTTSAQLKLLISKQPLEDRENLEFGKITIRKEFRTYPYTSPQRVSEGVLLIESERNGKITSYKIDRSKGTITKLPNQSYQENKPTLEHNHYRHGKKFDEVKPAGQQPIGITDENKSAESTINSFGSARTQYIVDALITDIDLPAVEKSAKGQTTFDTEVPLHEVIQEIALNLIPFRSAIVNFTKGNLAGGLVDLAFDIFGFAVGLGAAAKAAKAVGAGASALSKAGQAFKIIGRAAVGSLNPLSGLDDLAKAAGKKLVGAAERLGNKVAGFNDLRAARDADWLALAKKDEIAEVVIKNPGNGRDVKTLAKIDKKTGKAYQYSAKSDQAYGRPLEGYSLNPAGANDRHSLLGTKLATDNLIQAGDTMSDLKVLDKTTFTFVDNVQNTSRLNILAHGYERLPHQKIFNLGTEIAGGNGKSYTPDSFMALLKQHNIDPSKYDSIRFITCHVGEAGTHSFAAKFGRITKKPVAAFEGPVFVKANDLDQPIKDRLKISKFQNPGLDEDRVKLLAQEKLKNDFENKIDRIIQLETEHGLVHDYYSQSLFGKTKRKQQVINYRPVFYGKKPWNAAG